MMGPGPAAGDRQQNGAPATAQFATATTSSSSSKPGSPAQGDPMDITPTAANPMGPPVNSSPEVDPQTTLPNGAGNEISHASGNHPGNSLTAAAATSASQPKMVNTAFIHKLYNMLEDPNIRDLIAWSADGEGFLMSPSADFARVLSQYFKHTNVSSFVRQLNMYGFHKVSDVFHNGQSESALWQFKHGNGNFKRGDLAGLREIKRRASRHTLIHRDSFSGPSHHHKQSVSQPGTPAEPLIEPGEVRLAHLEHNLYDMHARLVRTEESNTALSAKCQALNESLVKAHQWHIEMTHMITSLIPDPDNQVRRDANALERDIARQLDAVRNYEDSHEALLSGRQPYFSNMALGEPVSPRQNPLDEQRRQTLHALPPRANLFRHAHGVPQPTHPTTTVPQRRYGSIGTANPLPNYHRPLQPHSHNPPIPPPSQHPLSHVSEPPSGPNLGRRHTSADIRLPGWPTNPGGAMAGNATGGSPLTSGQSSVHWPSSPMQVPAANPDDQSVRDQLSSYTFGSRQPSLSHPVSGNNVGGAGGGSQQNTPPLTTSNDTTPSTLSMESNWSFGGAAAAAGLGGGGGGGSKFPGARHLDSSAPATRRSSMASNVHSLLNPAETAERDEEDPLGPTEERKRKRIG